MQLKEIDKEATQAAELRPSPVALATAEHARQALLPARARLEAYSNAFLGRLTRSEEAYGREVSLKREGARGPVAGGWLMGFHGWAGWRCCRLRRSGTRSST